MSYGDSCLLASQKNPIWGWILPLFSRHRLLERLILPCSPWGAGAGGCAALGCLAGGRSTGTQRACSTCVDISACGVIASVCPACFLSLLWSPWKPCWVPASCLSCAYAMNLGFPLQAILCVPLAFLSGNGVGSSRKRFNKSIHVLILEGPSPQNLDTLNET